MTTKTKPLTAAELGDILAKVFQGWSELAIGDFNNNGPKHSCTCDACGYLEDGVDKFNTRDELTEACNVINKRLGVK